MAPNHSCAFLVWWQPFGYSAVSDNQNEPSALPRLANQVILPHQPGSCHPKTAQTPGSVWTLPFFLSLPLHLAPSCHPPSPFALSSLCLRRIHALAWLFAGRLSPDSASL